MNNPPVSSRGTRSGHRPGRSHLPRPALSLPPLPVPLTSFIGREEVIARIATVVRHPETRLLTLTGAGGVGKSRIAIKVASDLQREFADGAGFFPLGTVREPALVLPAIARALGIAEGDRQSLIERLGAHLSDRQCLLVLDNFEQVAAAGPAIVNLLQAAPGVTMLVTSRAPLRVSGEMQFPIPPMTLPASDAEVLDAEAVRLFMTRATAVRPDVASTEAITPAIAEICRRLDGLPLAIELAAARSNLLAPPVMRTRLNHRLPLLTSGPRDQPARLQTMHNAIAWSYDLLTEHEQALFRRLSTLVGSFPLAAAVAIGDAPESTILAGLGTLIDQSLVQPAPRAGDEPRYTMLETIREFGHDELVAAGEETDARERHAHYFVELAERTEQDVDGPAAPEALALLDLDRPNLQAALDWLIDHEETEDALRLSAALWRFWRIRGYLSEGRDGLAGALALPGSVASPVRADALWKLGYMLFFLGEYDAARDRIEQSVALFAKAGDQAGEATALDSLGTVWLALHELQRARTSHERALAIRQEMGNRFESGVTLANLGRIALHLGEPDAARAMLEEALAIARESGSRREFGHRCLNLSQVEIAERKLPAARELVKQALVIFEEIGDQVAIADSLEMLGQVTSELGDARRGTGLLVSSLRLRWKLGLQRNLTECIERLASAALPLDPALATRLMASAATSRDEAGMTRAGWDAISWDEVIAAARAALGDDAFDEAWRDGSQWTLRTASREAEAAFADRGTREYDLNAVLTPRELEILRLVGAGHSNSSIAETLFISSATVKRHVTNMLAKLSLPNRAAAVKAAIDAGLLDDREGA